MATVGVEGLGSKSKWILISTVTCCLQSVQYLAAVYIGICDHIIVYILYTDACLMSSDVALLSTPSIS